MQSPTSHPVPASSTLAVIGAGPIGLEAAAWAVSHDWEVVLFEKETIGHHIRQWGHVKLFSPFQMNRSRWGPGLLARAFPDLVLPSESSYLRGTEYVARYLEPLAQLPELSSRIFPGTRVIQIGKEGLTKSSWVGEQRRLDYPFRILVSRGNREFIHRTRAVIDASGVYSSPQFMGSGNIPAPGELEAKKEAGSHLCCGIPDLLGTDRLRFADRKTLLVGGGHSAATTLEAFQKLVHEAAQTKVFWLNRSRENEPYELFENDPLPARDALSRLGNRLALRPPDWLECLPGSTVQRITGWPQDDRGAFEVTVETDSGHRKLQVDEIISNVGFIPDHSLYRQLQIHECYATAGPIKLAATLLDAPADCLAQRSEGIETLANPEPSFFILGNKSYGTNSTFLLTTGIQQIETVMPHLEETLGYFVRLHWIKEVRTMIKETILKTYSTAAAQMEAKLCCGVDYRQEFTPEEINHIPDDVLDRNYGCGIPSGLRSLEPGQQVLDLGPGFGRDCFIAARMVGPEGRVFGLDMNDNMIRQAERYKSEVVAHLGYDNVGFLKGQFDVEIPLGDDSIDVILSNCVNNLAQDKSRSYSEMFRVLKSGSQLSFSDIVSYDSLPAVLRKNEKAWADCISGVLSFQDLNRVLEEAGFHGVTLRTEYLWKSGTQILEDYFDPNQLSKEESDQLEAVRLYSVAVEAFKPTIDPAGECYWKGQQALFHGPAVAFQLDADPEHIFKAGELKEVCEKTATILKSEPFGRHFTVFEPQGEVEVRACLPADKCC